jgi:hypothetical protein
VSAILAAEFGVDHVTFQIAMEREVRNHLLELGDPRISLGDGPALEEVPPVAVPAVPTAEAEPTKSELIRVAIQADPTAPTTAAIPWPGGVGRWTSIHTSVGHWWDTSGQIRAVIHN